MSHLSLETLARIADGPVTDAETAHLDECRTCREELERMCEEIGALGELPDPAAPPGLWNRVEADLDRSRGRFRRSASWLHAAAAVAVFAAGSVSGWALRGASSPDVAPATVAEGTGNAFGDPAGTDDPGTRLRRAEDAYVRAVTEYLDAHPEAAPASVVPYERMAALHGIALTARAALEQAPEDPVIGGYYRTAVSQQRALMSNVAVPVSNEDEPWF